MKFFLIDDDPEIIEIQKVLLQDAGHTVLSETESDNALARVLAERPDCVIIDLMMPGRDGYELVTMIRKMKELDDTKIVVLTSKHFEQDRRQSIRYGADGFMAKSFVPESYLETLAIILADDEAEP